MAPLDRLLHSLNRKRGANVLRQMPTHCFHDAKEYATFRLNPDMPLFILFLYRAPVRGLEVTVDTARSADLTLGKMHYLYSGATLFGYLFEFPFLPVRLYQNFCAVNTTDFDPQSIRGVAPIVQNNELTVYGCSDTSVVIIANAVKLIDVTG